MNESDGKLCFSEMKRGNLDRLCRKEVIRIMIWMVMRREMQQTVSKDKVMLDLKEMKTGNVLGPSDVSLEFM